MIMTMIHGLFWFVERRCWIIFLIIGPGKGESRVYPDPSWFQNGEREQNEDAYITPTDSWRRS